jgi:hypothetical protein
MSILEYICLVQLGFQIMGNRLIKIYVEGFCVFNKQNCTVFCNMVMLRVNIGRNIATLDGHAILLNKYFNKYERGWCMFYGYIYTLPQIFSLKNQFSKSLRQLRVLTLILLTWRMW